MNFERLDDLLHRFGEDALEANEQEELTRMLEANSEARARAVRHFHAQSLLTDVLGAGALEHSANQETTAEKEITSERPNAVSRGLPRASYGLPAVASVLAIALTAGFVAVVAYLWGLHEGERQAQVTSVVVVDLEGAKFQQGKSLREGDRLGSGEIHLVDGRLGLKFDCGATLSLLGPARLAILDDRTARLDAGRVSVEAPESAVGFTVRTSTGDYVDLGTEFGVSVGDDGSSEIHVFDGVVIARPRESDLALPVFEREAGRVEPDSGAVVSVEVDDARFDRAGSTKREMRPTDDPSQAPDPTAFPAIGPDARVVFLGDQHVDKDTHLLLIRQAFDEAGVEGPTLFNAAEALPLKFDEEEYLRYVELLEPTHAVVQFGPEAARSARNSDAESFRNEVARLLDRLAESHVEAILATGYLPGTSEQERSTAREFDRVVRSLAKERGLRLIDLASSFDSSADDLRTPDRRLPSFAGYREIARSTLAGFGYADVPVPARLRPELAPGTITDWRVLYAAEAQRAIEDPSLLPDFQSRSGWRELRLPQDDLFAMRAPDPYSLVSYRDRARGFATHLGTKETGELLAIATIESDLRKEVWINLGASAKGVLVNGELVYRSARWTGWHAGRDRVRVTLEPGENQIILYASGSFFLSVTDDLEW